MELVSGQEDANRLKEEASKVFYYSIVSLSKCQKEMENLNGKLKVLAVKYTKDKEKWESDNKKLEEEKAKYFYFFTFLRLLKIKFPS